jgi:hypothetical protein
LRFKFCLLDYQHSKGSFAMDLQAMMYSVGICFLWWAVAVLGATLSGYPGVVFLTPAAWLLAIPAGITCVARSESARRATRLLEAGLAGGIFGLLEGMSCTIVLATSSDQVGFVDVTAAVVSGLIVGILAAVIGLVVCAALAVGGGALQERRRRSNGT